MRGSRFALLLLSALLENFLGFHSASLEHNASSARAGPSHSDCKYRKNIRKFQIIEEEFSNSIYYRLWFLIKDRIRHK